MSFNRPTARPERSADRDRPSLWVEGSQQPRLDLRAFGRVSLILSRQTARPVLAWLSALTDGGAQRMAANGLGPRLVGLGRLGRALPPRDRVAAGLQGLARLLMSAADVAVPPPPAVPLTYPDLLEPAPQTMARRPRRAAPRLDEPAVAEPAPAPPPPDRPAGTEDFDAPTLAAIRAMIDEMREATPVAPQRPSAAPAEPPTGRVLLTHGVPLTPPEPRAPGLGERAAAQALHLTAVALAWGVTLVSWPVGAVKAVLIHLDGEDLRTWP